MQGQKPSACSPLNLITSRMYAYLNYENILVFMVNFPTKVIWLTLVLFSGLVFLLLLNFVMWQGATWLCLRTICGFY